MIESPPKTRRRTIVYAKRMKTKPMTKVQLEQVNEEINQIYLFLISRTNYDPMVIEILKLSALSNVYRRFKSGEPWIMVD
jgi:hypothetical protein